MGEEAIERLRQKMLAELEDPENIARLQKVLEVVDGTRVFPVWFHRCFAWTAKARDAIVALGEEYYDNDEYRITYVDWEAKYWYVFPKGHIALRVYFKESGNVYYLDDGQFGGTFDTLPKGYGQEMGINPLVPRDDHIPFWPWEN